MANSQKRIMKELAELTSNPPSGMTVRLIDEDDIHKWEVLMNGPEQSIYSGAHFRIALTLPKDYPFKPPVLQFATKIYHPNVSNDDKGSMCLGLLRADTWKPVNKISAVLDLVRNTLIEPNPDDAVEAGVADEYRNNYKIFEKNARDWVRKYANKQGGENR